MLEIHTLTVGPFQSNCYILSCKSTNKAIIVDAGDEAERILGTVDRLGVTVETIVNTHAHLDHVSGLPEVLESLQVPVLMHKAEMPIYDSIAEQAAMFGLSAPRQVEITRFIEAGDRIRVGDHEAEVLLTPGHSPGSVCLAFGGEPTPVLIAGDTLFMGSIGRTDLPGGDWDTMMETLADVFLELDDRMEVYPGHGPRTTIGAEKVTNPFLAPLTRNRR